MRWYEERVFPWMLERVASGPLGDWQARCVQDASGLVLDIGIGTGSAVHRYRRDRVTDVVALEPSRVMLGRARQRLRRCGFSGLAVCGVGERLPFADQSFDTIVIVLVLCSVAAPEAMLAEIRRVLRPNGRLLFLEHVRNDDSPRARRWQHRLDPVQRRVACGCSLVRPTLDLMRAAGFTIREADRPRLGFSLQPALFPMVLGTAVPTGAAATAGGS